MPIYSMLIYVSTHMYVYVTYCICWNIQELPLFIYMTYISYFYIHTVYMHLFIILICSYCKCMKHGIQMFITYRSFVCHNTWVIMPEMPVFGGYIGMGVVRTETRASKPCQYILQTPALRPLSLLYNRLNNMFK